MSDDSDADAQDEYKINTVIAARRAFERSEERDHHQQQHGGNGGNAAGSSGNNGRRQTVRHYESPGRKYCPCCKDKLSTGILLCNSGLMTVTSQIGVISTIYVATQGSNIVPGGLVVVFLLACFTISIFGLCGIIGPIRKTYGNTPPQQESGAGQKAGSNLCILSYMVANTTVLFIFFIAVCVCLSFLSGTAALEDVLKDLRAIEIANFDAVGQWIMDFVTQPEYREDWIAFQEVSARRCCVAVGGGAGGGR
jgi:hypothetical protein